MKKFILIKIVFILSLIPMLSGCLKDLDIQLPESKYELKSIQGLLGDKVSSARVSMKNNNIEYCDKNGVYTPCTVEDYKRIKNLKEENLIGYYRLFSAHNAEVEETEKVLQAMGYESWDDFLTQKNHLDESGKPSIKIWEESVYIELQKEYDSI